MMSTKLCQQAGSESYNSEIILPHVMMMSAKRCQQALSASRKWIIQ